MKPLNPSARKRRRGRASLRCISLIATTTFGLVGVAEGATLTWDSSGASAGSPVDGSGTWSTADALWSNGTSDQAWNNADADTPIFGSGGAGGTVTVDANGVTATGITFHSVSGPSPYTLTGGPITLTASVSNLISTPNSGVAPVIFSSLVGPDGKSRFVTFSGAINLSASANSYLGRTVVTQTNVFIGSNGNQAYSAPFGGADNMLTLDNSIITANGSHTGGSVSYQLPYNIAVTGNNTIFTGKNFTLGALSTTLYTVQGNGSLIFNNNLSATTSNISASFSGAGPDAFTGTLHLNTVGSNTIKLYPTGSGNFLGVPNGTLDVNASASPQTIGGPFTFTLGALTGTGSLGGGFTSATIATYSVGSLGLATTFSGTISGNAALTLTGGTLTLAAPSFNPNTYVGNTTVSAGTLIFKQSQTATANVSVSGGQLQLAHSGSANIIRTGAVLVTGGSIDLTDNKLISTLSPVGTWNGSAYTDISGLIASGRNNGSWNGGGILTSESNAGLASALTTVAVASAGAVGYGGTKKFGGVSVNSSDVLVMYTYAGDANLDGKVDADDYFQIDSHYDKSANSAKSYINGDFNYDGQFNGEDYFLIDSAFAAHGPPFPGLPALGDVSAVPEPAGAVLLFAAGLLLRRRSRTSCDSRLQPRRAKMK